MTSLQPAHWTVDVTDRMYVRLLRLWYPRSFRAEYEPHVVQVFRDLLREAVRERGIRGVVILWFRALRDLGASGLRLRLQAVSQWMRSKRPPTPHRSALPPRRRVPIASLLKDVGYGVRMLRRSPGFSLIAVLTLAIGIGANTAIFSVVNGVLLRPLPYHAPDQLVYIWDRFEWVGIPRASVSAPQVDDLRRQATLFEGFAALRTGSVRLTGGGEPEQVRAGIASANFFDLLGARAALGRVFVTGDDDPGAPWVVVLSHGFWLRRFGGDSSVVGTTIMLDDQPATVAGVLPGDFHFAVESSLSSPRRADLWLPYQVDLANASRSQHGLSVLARIEDGVTFDQAQAELQALGQQQDEQWFGNNGFTFTTVAVHDDLVSHLRPTLFLLLGAVAFLLLIATANIATLMLARSQLRAREIAVRTALGASRGRIMWMAFAEGGVLAVLGGALGFAVAAVGLDGLLALAPDALPRQESITVDGRLFTFAGVVVLATAMLCGVAPAFQSSRLKLTTSLREGGRGAVGLGRAMRARNALVVVEVALSLMLLTGAGLLVRSLALMAQADPGFEPTGILTFDVELPDSRYGTGAARRAFFEGLLGRLRSMPGVEGVAATGTLPVSAEHTSQTDGRPDVLTDEDDAVMYDYMPVTPEYFSIMGIEVVAGRAFTAEDRSDMPWATVIDEKAAAYWPGGNAVGRTIDFLGQDWTVVGVVRHARLYRVYEDDRPQFYAPYAQLPFHVMAVAIKTELEPTSLMAQAQAAVVETDPNQPISNVRTMEGRVRASTAERRFGAMLMTAFAVTGLLLAALGVYGVLSYSVANRTHEIAIRMALGALQTNVIRLVVRQGLVVTAAGLLFGLLGSVGLSRVMTGMVYEIQSVDPVTYAVVPATLVAIAAVACLVPTWRATRVDPLEAMREE
jgi:putative ABC transport system permease protein